MSMLSMPYSYVFLHSFPCIYLRLLLDRNAEVYVRDASKDEKVNMKVVVAYIYAYMFCSID